MDGDNIVEVLVVVIAVSVVMLAGMLILSTTGSVIETEQRDDTVLLGDAGEFVEIQSFGSGSDETVLNSRGNAAQFTGANDSHVTPREAIGIDVSQNWTVSQGVWVNASATGDEMIFLSLGDGDVLLRFDGPNTQWQAWVFRPPNDTYAVNVSASDPTNETVVQVMRENDTLTIFENNSAGESADLSQSNSTSVDPDAGNLHGVLDETNVIQHALSSADRQALVDNPVRPVDAEPIGRLMYDEFTDGDFRVYFSSGTAETSNISLVSGFAGEEMDRDGLLSTGDYEWEDVGPKIAPVEGQRLDGHPVAFVAYTYDRGGGFMNGLSSVFDLGALLPVVLVATLVFVVAARLRE